MTADQQPVLGHVHTLHAQVELRASWHRSQGGQALGDRVQHDLQVGERAAIGQEGVQLEQVAPLDGLGVVQMGGHLDPVKPQGDGLRTRRRSTHAAMQVLRQRLQLPTVCPREARDRSWAGGGYLLQAAGHACLELCNGIGGGRERDPIAEAELEVLGDVVVVFVNEEMRRDQIYSRGTQCAQLFQHDVAPVLVVYVGVHDAAWPG
jgi:hypothetical protein